MQNEKNEATQMENSQSSQQESKSKSENPSTLSTSEQSNQDVKNLRDLERNRIIFLALLDAAMRYRQEYFRDESEVYYEMLLAATEQKEKELGAKADRGWRRRADKINEETALKFYKKQEDFNKSCYKEIDSIVERMEEKFKLRFDNYATGFALMCEEFLKAKNTTELLTLAKLYNQGLLDTVFEQVRKEKDEKNNNGSDSAIGDSELQEEQPTADVEQPTASAE